MTIVDHADHPSDIQEAQALFEEAHRRRRRRRVAVGTLVIVLGVGALAWWVDGDGLNGHPPGRTAPARNAESPRVQSESHVPALWARSTFHGDRLTVSFAHPIAWRSQLQPFSLHYGTMFGFLSNFGLQQFCRSAPTGGFGCIWADLGQFPRNGVLMTFGTGFYGPGRMSQQELLGPGTPTTIGGHVAHRQMGNGQECLGTGALSSVSYRALDGKIQGVFSIEFCYRGPSPGTFRSQVDQVARSLHLGPGPPGLGPQPS